MKKVIFILLTGLIILNSSCKKSDIYDSMESTPVMFKVQAVDVDNTVTESQTISIN